MCDLHLAILSYNSSIAPQGLTISVFEIRYLRVHFKKIFAKYV